MRILFTVSNYFPENGGGAAEVVRQIAERMAALGHEVGVATKRSAKRTNRVINGVRIEEFDVSSPLGQSVLGIRGQLDEYVRTITDPSLDVVVNYAAQTWHADMAFKVADSMRATRVLCACGFSGLIGWRRWLYRGYFKRLPAILAKYDAVVYHSSQYIDKAFADAAGLSNSRVIPNAVESASFRKTVVDVRAKYRITEKHILLCVGDHFKNKGHDRVIAAVEACKTVDVCLLIYGRAVSGSWRGCEAECTSKAARSRRRIILVADGSRGEIVSAYATASLFLSGSRIEAFPLVILEAMASALPFLASPAGNVAELPGGRVVQSTAEMASSIDLLLEDPVLRAQLGAQGLEKQTAHYDWDHVVPQYLSLFESLIESRCAR